LPINAIHRIFKICQSIVIALPSLSYYQADIDRAGSITMDIRIKALNAFIKSSPTIHPIHYYYQEAHFTLPIYSDCAIDII